MNLCDLLRKKDFLDMLKGFKESPDYDVREEELIKQKDERPRPMVVECLHHTTITLTNGSVQCLRCKMMLKVVEPTWKR